MCWTFPGLHSDLPITCCVTSVFLFKSWRLASHSVMVDPLTLPAEICSGHYTSERKRDPLYAYLLC